MSPKPTAAPRGTFARRRVSMPARFDAEALDPNGIPLTVVGLDNRREDTVFFRTEQWLAQLLGVAGRFGGSTVRRPSFPGLQFLARYRGSFTPKTSTRSISGGLENNSAALAMRALAIGPLR